METIYSISLYLHWDFFIIKNYSLFTHKQAFVIYISFSIQTKLAAHDQMWDLYMGPEILRFMKCNLQRYVFWVPTKSIWLCNSLNSCILKQSSCNTVWYDVGVRTPNQTQRRTYFKTFITSVFSVVLSGAQTPSTEYKSEYEYEKSFITLGPDSQSSAYTTGKNSIIYSNETFEVLI